MIKKFLLILLIAWSVGIGARMIFEYPNFYHISTFNLWFDWTPLALLAVINLAILCRDFLKGDSKTNLFGDRR